MRHKNISFLFALVLAASLSFVNVTSVGATPPPSHGDVSNNVDVDQSNWLDQDIVQVGIGGKGGNGYGGDASCNGCSASAGNGGTANSSANGGAIYVGDINSGGNVGNVIDVSLTMGSSAPSCGCYGKGKHGYPASGGSVDLTVYGGYSSNSFDLDISANGGTAIADASGGNNNSAGISVQGGDGYGGPGGDVDQDAWNNANQENNSWVFQK